MPAANISADVLIERFQRSLRHPVHYLAGGWGALVAALQRRAVQGGARIVCARRVEQVISEQGRATGVRLADGSVVRASAVVIATSPRAALRLLDAGGATPLRALVDGLVPAPVACPDVALRELPNPHQPVVQDLDRPRFLSAQSAFAPVAPGGGARGHLQAA